MRLRRISETHTDELIISSPNRLPLLVQVLKAVDLYCGCGGMSFMDHRSEEVHIETQWAVDSQLAMCCSFEVNYPSTKVTSLCCLCVCFGRLQSQLPITKVTGTPVCAFVCLSLAAFRSTTYQK